MPSSSVERAADSSPPPAWSPLRHKVFRGLWTAALASNVGTWMQDTGSAWLMTSLAPTPTMVAAVQVATTLPILGLALPAGALADIVDRRRLLMAAQLWMLLMAAILGAATLLQRTAAELLLVLTLCLGFGSAFSMTAWASVIPELVPRAQLQAAISLNALSMNVSRAIGPALAGFLIAQTGPATVFFLNAASFLGVLAVLKVWKRPPKESSLPAERLFGAIGAGFRYARHSHALLRIVIRVGAFFTFASAPWALMPLLVRQEWGGGPTDYGLLLASVGGGAIVSVFLLPRLRARLSGDWLVALGSLTYAGTLPALAKVGSLPLGLVAGCVAGAAWLTVLTTLQGAAQAALPAWVRGRGLSMVMMAMMAGLAAGSLLWGQVASFRSIPDALVIAGIGLALCTLVILPLRIGGHETLDLTPSMHWPSPNAEPDLDYDRGPVLVTLAYRVDPDRREDFLLLMKRLSKVRRRDGAYYWQLFRDTGCPDQHLESFLVESWVEHLRQHERVTVEDRWLQQQVQDCLVDHSQPQVSHWIAETG